MKLSKAKSIAVRELVAIEAALVSGGYRGCIGFR